MALGGEPRRPAVAGRLDQRIRTACQALLRLAVDHNLTNAALLAERRAAAHREREKAEALHSLKDRLHDDAQSFLRDAVEDLIAGREPRVAEGKALGCALQKH